MIATMPWLCAPAPPRCRGRPAALDLVDQCEDAARRLGVGALEDERDQEIDLAVGLVKRPALAQQSVEQRGGAAAGRRHVDMRIGAVADHRAGVLDHRRGHVGMVVEAGHDRQPVADQRADAAQQFALAVVVVLGDHRAVQVEIDPVDFSLGAPCAARSSSIAPATRS